MAEKLVPPTKPVGKPDGIKQGSSNSHLTTPDFDSVNGNKIFSSGDEKGKIFSKK